MGDRVRRCAYAGWVLSPMLLKSLQPKTHARSLCYVGRRNAAVNMRSQLPNSEYQLLVGLVIY